MDESTSRGLESTFYLERPSAAEEGEFTTNSPAPGRVGGSTSRLSPGQTSTPRADHPSSPYAEKYDELSDAEDDSDKNETAPLLLVVVPMSPSSVCSGGLASSAAGCRREEAQKENAEELVEGVA